MKRKELMAAVALAAGMTAGVAATTNTFAAPKNGVEQAHPGHTIGKGHFSHGNGLGLGHENHQHDNYRCVRNCRRKPAMLSFQRVSASVGLCVRSELRPQHHRRRR